MQLNHTYFPFHWDSTSLLLSTLTLKKAKQNKTPSQVQFVLFIYSLEHSQTPSCQPLKGNRILPPHPALTVIKPEELCLSIFIMIFKDSLQQLHVLTFSFVCVGEGGVGIERFNISHSQVWVNSYQYPCKRSFPTDRQQSVAAWTTYITSSRFSMAA